MRLRSIDGWRGIGALLVALGHLEIAGFADFGGYLPHAHVLVDFFFVVSGFVIAAIYLDTLVDVRSTVDFAIRRFGRLWPLHAVLLGAFVLAEFVKLAAVEGFGHVPVYAPFEGQRPADMIVPTLAMLHVFGIDDALTWNFPSWSVAAEFWVYLLFAGFAVATAGHRGVRLPLSVAIVAGAGMTMIALSPNRMDGTYDFGLIRCAYGFFAGVLLAAVSKRGLVAPFAGTAAELAATVMGVVFVATAAGTPAEFAAPFVWAAVTAVFAADAGQVSRLLARPVFEVLGRWSYSVYLVHALVLTVVMPKIFAAVFESGPQPVLGSLMVAAVYLVLVIGLSGLTYHLVEVPGQRAASRLAKRWGRRAVAPRPALA